MATVRTMPPRGLEPGNKRKRKRIGKSKILSESSSSLSPLSAVEAQLQTLENWHRALTIDLREVRREGSRVRTELAKVTDAVEDAVENSERCALQAQTTQDRALTIGKAKDLAFQETQRKLQAAEARHNAELMKMNKKLVTMDKRLENYKQSSINEEFLMTLLTQLQEQYEDELAKVREDHKAALAAQEKQSRSVKKALVKLQEENKQTKQLKTLERMLKSLRDDNEKLSQRVTEMATRQAMYTLQQQVETRARDNQDEQGRMRMDLDTFGDRLVEVERRFVDTNSKRLNAENVNGSYAAMSALTNPGQTLTPPHLPQDVVRQADLVEFHDELRRINQNFQAVGVDFAALAKRTDARRRKQEQHTEAKLQALSTQLFDALGHDSRLHAAEISRLKDAIFDVQSNHRELGQQMRRLEDDVQQATSSWMRANSPQDHDGGRDWCFGQNQPSALPQQPPPLSSRRSRCNRRERPSRYEPAPDPCNDSGPMLPQDRVSWAPQRENRHRSRSPPSYPPWGVGASGNNSSHSDSGWSAFAQNNRIYEHGERRDNLENSNGEDSAWNTFSRPADSAQYAFRNDRRDTSEDNQEEQRFVPFRRNRQPRRIPEVIVIEENDDNDEDNDDDIGSNDDEGSSDEEVSHDDEKEADTAPSRAPPDVISDEEVLQPVDGAIVASPSTPSADYVEPADLLQRVRDLQTGFWLYFCLGGAPDLDVQWTTYFTQLNADECVEMPRTLLFQRRYVFLQSFPMCLTQCILHAVILNGQGVLEDDDPEAFQETNALNAQNMRVKFDDVVNEIRLSWADALVEHLMKRASESNDVVTDKVELSANPAGMSSTADKDDVIYEWSRRQESAMWTLARKLHNGSFLPAMKCNENASPSVYLFALMFDVLTVTSECPQFGSFCLNDFGGTLMAHLWDHTLKKLPYVFFADWRWLEDQSTKKAMPALAFCHILASILLWNSAIDRPTLTNCNTYAAAVKHILPKLFVNGHPTHESTADPNSFLLTDWKSSRIELLDLDSKFASMLGLDGFFEVTEAIKSNMLAKASAAKG